MENLKPRVKLLNVAWSPSLIDGTLLHGKVFTRFPGENGWIETRKHFLHSSSFVFRALILFLSAFLLIGPAFQYEFPSALQGSFETSLVDAHGNEGLNMGPLKYNLLFAVYAWSCGITMLFSSYFAEQNSDQRLLILYGAFICCSGSVCISFGASQNLFYLLIIGRGLLGAGAGVLSGAQQALIYYWFGSSKLAFAVVQLVTRLGPVLNFFLLPHLSGYLGLVYMLWLGVAVCSCSLGAAIIIWLMSKFSQKEESTLGDDVADVTHCISLKLAKSLPSGFWMLCSSTMLLYGSIFPFIANANLLLQNIFITSITALEAAQTIGTFYATFLVVAPFATILLTYFGNPKTCNIYLRTVILLLSGLFGCHLVLCGYSLVFMFLLGKRGYTALAAVCMCATAFCLLYFSIASPFLIMASLGALYTIGMCI